MFQTNEFVIHLIYAKIISLISGVCLSFIRGKYVEEFVEMIEFEEVALAQQLTDDDWGINEKSATR